MKKRSESKEVLDRAEWDFADVPKSEAEACLRYELGREIQNPEEYFTKPWKPAVVPAHSSVVVGDRPIKCLLGWRVAFRDSKGYLRAAPEEFPAVPWQNLKNEVREHLSRLAKFPGVIVYPEEANLVGDSDGSSLRIPLYQLRGSNQLLPININWDLPDASLISAFRVMLKHYRPKKKRSLLGRQSTYDVLRALGALRLRHRYTAEEAYKISAAFGQPLYHYAHAWERSRRRVLEEFAKAFPDAGPPVSEAAVSNRRTHQK
jgi:hypothetical protein